MAMFIFAKVIFAKVILAQGQFELERGGAGPHHQRRAAFTILGTIVPKNQFT